MFHAAGSVAGGSSAPSGDSFDGDGCFRLRTHGQLRLSPASPGPGKKSVRFDNFVSISPGAARPRPRHGSPGLLAVRQRAAGAII